MALTVTEKFRMTAGGRAWRVYEVVHDGSTLTLDASAVDLSYIDAIAAHSVYVSMQAPASTFVKNMTVSISADNKSIVWDGSDANAKSYLTLIGW